ncbi:MULTISPECIES: rhomboid-like protein [unclassified Rhodococcus (in: high G+C Gram-positive bacteria)]|uniref:rhomboid-like protein n=1 Tax=unclassified Rhodococcus (in: high G+C Gram-positive bacteria) TaxID=192944 RepID=UPI0028A00441|nr:MULTISPECIES: rhomboid-like protein [unclassified Rhodococcus (in: high G+C Gram-positive bacteria)]
MKAVTAYRFRNWVRAAWTYVRRAPGTFVWLAVLLATTVVSRYLSAEQLQVVLGDRSTNLHHLAEDPVRVLIASAFWLAGGGWVTYFFLFNVFHVPAERWLGTLRWVTVVAIAHVGATYLSEGALYWAIRHGHAPVSAVDTLDVGVSYGLAGVVAVLTYRIAPPWRYPYLAAVLVFYLVPLFVHLNFTAVGHFTAVLLGLCCYPITRSRKGVWSPVAAVRRMRRTTATA